jgi:hypothetical protein
LSGNDIVVVVFVEPGATFDPCMMKTQFNRTRNYYNRWQFVWLLVAKSRLTVIARVLVASPQ